MAAITGITSDTTLANIINAEHISNTLKEIERAPVLAEMIADVRDASGTNALTYVFPKFSDLTLSYNEDSGFADDGDEVSASAQTPTQAVATAVTVPIRQAISDDAQQGSIIDAIAAAMLNGAAKLRDMVDVDLFENATGITLSAGTSGTDLTLARFGAGLAAFRATNPSGRGGALLHPRQVSDMRDDARANGGALFGSSHGGMVAGTLMTSARGHLGSYEGLEIFESSNCVQADANNWNGFITEIGPGGGFGLAVWRGVTTKIEYRATRLVTEVVQNVRYGTCLRNDATSVKVISSKT